MISSLVGTFQDAENSVVQAAFEALVQIGDDRAIQALLAALNDPNPELRRYAVESLGNFWGDEVIAGLVVAIYDEDDYVRRAAFDALVEIGDTEALYPYLNQSSSRNVYWALMRIGGEDVEEVLIGASGNMVIKKWLLLINAKFFVGGGSQRMGRRTWIRCGSLVHG